MINNKSDSSTQKINIDDTLYQTAVDACLIIISGNEENKKFSLQHERSFIGKRYSIGRNQNNDIVINDSFLSSIHAEIIEKNNKYYIRDRKSTNGTYLNGQRIDLKTELKNQDKIRLGNTVLKFLQGDIEALFLDNLREKMNLDELTKIFNRKYFDEQFKIIFNTAKRYKKKLSLIMFDIDDFKRINDTYGHDAGDYILSTLCKIINDRIRETDIFARIGGEEFAIICPETDIANSYKLSEILCNIISEHKFIYNYNEIPVTISMGVCEYIDLFDEEKDMYKNCDILLYKSKKSGKNRVTI